MAEPCHHIYSRYAFRHHTPNIKDDHYFPSVLETASTSLKCLSTMITQRITTSTTALSLYYLFLVGAIRHCADLQSAEKPPKLIKLKNAIVSSSRATYETK